MPPLLAAADPELACGEPVESVERAGGFRLNCGIWDETHPPATKTPKTCFDESGFAACSGTSKRDGTNEEGEKLVQGTLLPAAGFTPPPLHAASLQTFPVPLRHRTAQPSASRSSRIQSIWPDV